MRRGRLCSHEPRPWATAQCPRSDDVSTAAGYNSPRRSAGSPSRRAHDRRSNRSWRSTRRKCTRRSRAVQRRHGYGRIRYHHQATERRAEFPGQTLRIHPFASMRFHVLLNSLFKVLFNFPSRYLSAIGLVPVFSLRWSLPSALGCILKQPDSEEARRQRARRQKGPDTRYGRGHDQEDLGDEAHHQSASYTPHFPPTLRRGIRCWALPASLAVTRGILVSFFSSAY